MPRSFSRNAKIPHSDGVLLPRVQVNERDAFMAWVPSSGVWLLWGRLMAAVSDPEEAN